MADSGEVWQFPAILIAASVILPAIATFGLILALRPVLQQYALARPNARSSHRLPTPQGAGVAVVAVTLITILLLTAAYPDFNISPLLPVIGAVVLLAVVGGIDDVRALEVMPRLVIQSIAVLLVVISLPQEIRILSVLPFWLERALLFIALIWFVNLVNFMDGIDWMTVAEIVPVTAALGLFGLMGALPANAAVIALALCGAMLGFAPLNRPTARVFLGDVGALPIGLLLGWLLVMLGENHFAAACLLPLYYVGDATITLLRRLMNGENPMRAHRSHFYQRAMTGGQSVLAIVTRVFALNMALILLAACTILSGSLFINLAAMATGCVLVGWQLYRFHRVSEKRAA